MQIDEQRIKEVIDSITEEVKTNLSSESKEYIRFLQQLIEEGIPIPVLTVCGKGTQEIRFTKYFTYYLDETQLHGLKDKCLKYAFDIEAKEAGLSEDWYKGCNVYAEYNLGTLPGYNVNNYVDILIQGEGFVLCIEQKLFSGESNTNESNLGQLNRYSLAMAKNENFKDLQFIKVYLTPKESIPTTSNDWIPMSHETIILRLLPLMSDENLSLAAVENVKRLLLDFILGPYGSTTKVINQLHTLSKEVVKNGFPVSKTKAFIDAIKENHLLLEILRGGKYK
ncbi:PD-(D/E)XK nuclease family protein [Bacillus shivajii]|uniref:PD-(D/E)XK nuclease family protein n=1 Tax=Bacillus shivajii TaxID=1983719 RepID=UPI001CFA62FF|nr:PD-(D/E)XK nuclease family protein [Bacillus shivajii]UCZ52918.1 PD-(D/E)XK nuclease family protein [Bacillus shivajii]